MWRCFAWECQKTLLQRSFFIAVLLTLLINSFLFVRINLYGEKAEVYRNVWSDLNRLSEPERNRFVEEHIDHLEDLREQAFAALEPSSPFHIGTSSEWLPLSVDTKQLQYSEDVNAEYDVFHELNIQRTENASYPDFIAQTQDTAPILSVFDNLTAYEKAEKEKTAQAFSKFVDTKLPFVNVKAVETALNWRFSDLLILIILLLLLELLLLREKEEGQLQLLYPLRLGRKPLLRTRLLILGLSTLILSILFFGANYGIAAAIFGVSDLSVPLQAIPAYQSAYLSMSIGAYAALYTFVKTMAIFLFSLIAFFMALLIKNRTTFWLSLLGLLGIETLLRYIIPTETALSFLRYFNIIFLLEPNDYFRHYFNLNLAGLALSIDLIVLIFSCLGIVFFFFLNQSTFSKRMPVPSLREKTKQRPIKISLSILRHEHYKLGVVQRGILILIVFLGVQIFTVLNAKTFISAEEYYYRQYCSAYNQMNVTEARTAMQSERERLSQAHIQEDRLRLALQAGAINPFEAEKQARSIQQVLSTESAFLRVERRIDYLAELQNKSGHAYALYYDTGFRELSGFSTASQHSDIQAGLLFTLVVLLLFSNYVTSEHRIGTIKLTNVCLNGRKTLLNRQLLICLVYLFLAYIIAYWPPLMTTYRSYPLSGFWRVKMLELQEWHALSSTIPLWSFVLIRSLCRFCIGVIMLLLIFIIGRKLAKPTTIMGILGLVFVLPLVLALSGITLLNHSSFNAIFLFGKSITLGPFWLLLGPLGLIALLMILYRFLMLENGTAFVKRRRKPCVLIEK